MIFRPRFPVSPAGTSATPSASSSAKPAPHTHDSLFVIPPPLPSRRRRLSDSVRMAHPTDTDQRRQSGCAISFEQVTRLRLRHPVFLARKSALVTRRSGKPLTKKQAVAVLERQGRGKPAAPRAKRPAR